MIRINKQVKPVELTDALVKKLTNEYKQTGKSVWKKPYIERALLDSSHNKCCYCECKIDRESKYMEVEHFHDKSTYPDLVVEWDNLLPSCKRCNGYKSSYDTNQNPFINPCKTDPKNHLVLDSYRLFPKTIEGNNTIEKLFINHSTRMVLPRFQIGEAINEQILILLERIYDYNDGSKRTTQNKNSILSTVESLMMEGLPEEEYSATASTCMIKNPNFIKVIAWIKDEGWWNPSLTKIQDEVEKNSLDTDLSNVNIY